MIKYQVRSKELIDVIAELTTGRLIKSPYFQRNLVWREIHKIDFIKTILLGLPFPQIFIAKGEIDVESMTTYSCVVDGQQRLSSIQQYISGNLTVDGGTFDDLDKTQKETFLKYQIPIIDLDIKQNDPLLKEIFKRLNRTFYALSNIEKLSTEYAPSDSMVVAKVLTDQLFLEKDEEGNGTRDLDPLIPPDVIKAAKKIKVSRFQELILNNGVFSVHEIARKVHLSFVLNILATAVLGWYNRNTGVTRFLDDTSLSFKELTALAMDLDKIAAFILKLGFDDESYWFNKANLYSLIILLYLNREKLPTTTPESIADGLTALQLAIPEAYATAAKEAVNNKRERIIRHEFLEKTLFPV